MARPFAGRLPGLGILRHRGRRSGRIHSTPLNVFRRGSEFVVALTYGSGTDWEANLVAAGGGTLVHRGRVYQLSNPRRIPTEEGMAAMPRPVRGPLRALQVDEFLAVDAHPLDG